jgi:hypothetical protein
MIKPERKREGQTHEKTKQTGYKRNLSFFPSLKTAVVLQRESKETWFWLFGEFCLSNFALS